MSDLIILLLIIAPIALVVFILKSSKKKQKRRSQERLSAYVYEVTGQLGIKHSFRKQLVQQHLILDETSGKMVVIDHNKELSHEVYSLDHIRSLKVVSLKQTVLPDEQVKKAEVIITQVGVELSFERPDKEVFLVLYDHLHHNIFQLSDLQKEAEEIHGKIRNTKYEMKTA